MLKEYITSVQNNRTPDRFLNADISVLEPFQSESVSLLQALKVLRSKIPETLLINSGVDAITVGDLPFLDKIAAVSVLQDGSIYLSSKINTEAELIEAMIHEYAHAIEQRFAEILYSDGSVENEFLGKRIRLQNRLVQNGIAVPKKGFDNPNFDQKIFDLLFVKIGYERLVSLTTDLFVTTYGLSSLGEYFATSFSVFFFDQTRYEALRQLQPAMFRKLQILASWSEEAEQEE